MVNPGYGGETFASPHNVDRLVALGWEVAPGQVLPDASVAVVSEPERQPGSDMVETPEVVGRPAKSASRKVWATYAETLGIVPGVLTRGDLIAAVDAL